ncbi:hypothetical protein [Agathobaculum sp.]|uniref:hypothetical protein n=1 Tax=Agathobaculum sp. TaxID=2048138 RepID=UPI003AF1355E
MTIAEIAAQMGVPVETLVQEVIARESVKFQWLVILGALAIGLSTFYPLGLCHMQQRRGTGVWFIHYLRIDFCRCDVAHERDRLDCMENRAGNHGEPVYC